MAIYIGLIIFILFLPIVVRRFCLTKKKENKTVALIGMSVIFLILALKGDVGSDISGYLTQYNISATKAWGDVDYVYFESGYITLMKVFSKAGIDFQVFMVCIYALACSAMYFFIRKYSKDPTFSMIIFICYQFFVFYISGVRQTIAMSLCLYAYMVFQKRKLWSYISAFLITAVAFSIHQSSIIFFLVLIFAFIKTKKINIWAYLIGIAGTIVFRPFIWSIIDTYLRHVEVGTAITLGGNFIFLIGISLFMYMVNAQNAVVRISGDSLGELFDTHTVFSTRMLLLSVGSLILFSGHSLTRAAMYLSMFLIIGLPNTVYRLERKHKILLETAFIIFFILLFYFETLQPNQLELCPYKFFWE